MPSRVSKNVFFFGDSICFGQGVSLHNGWVTNLSRVIEAETKGLFTVVNSGINGNTTRLALERMPYDVQSHGIHTILIQFGLNDCNYWQSDNGLARVSEKAFAANLEEVVERSIKAGARNIFLNTNHPTLLPDIEISSCAYSYQDNARRYNEIVRQVAYDKNVGLNDIESQFYKLIESGIRLEDLLLPDLLHLSEEGHKVYFNLIAPIFTAALKQIVKPNE